jgi:hypothetical protein
MAVLCLSVGAMAWITAALRSTHEAHDMRSITNPVGIGIAVEFSIFDMAVMGRSLVELHT